MPQHSLPEPKKEQILKNKHVPEKAILRFVNPETTRIDIKNLRIFPYFGDPNIKKTNRTKRMHNILTEMGPTRTDVRQHGVDRAAEKHNTK